MNHLHKRPDDTFNRAAKVWRSDRTVVEADPVHLASTSECLAMKLLPVIHMQSKRFALDRPGSTYPETIEPSLFLHGSVGQAQAHRNC